MYVSLPLQDRLRRTKGMEVVCNGTGVDLCCTGFKSVRYIAWGQSYSYRETSS